MDGTALYEGNPLFYFSYLYLDFILDFNLN